MEVLMVVSKWNRNNKYFTRIKSDTNMIGGLGYGAMLHLMLLMDYLERIR